MKSFLSWLFRSRIHEARQRFYSGNKRFSHLGEADVDISEKARRHLAVFVHIPKAGGTSIKNLMLVNYGRRYQDFHPRINDFREKPEILAGLCAVSSHRPYGYHLALEEALRKSGNEEAWANREILAFSITRDPVDRMVSTFNFITTFPSHALYKMVHRMDAEEFFDFMKRERPVEFGNLQCQFIAGNARLPTFAEARNSMEARFAKVVDIASQSRLTEFLTERLGWTATGGENLRLNESPKKLHRSELGSNLLRMLEDANQEDLRLADYVRSLD